MTTDKKCKICGSLMYTDGGIETGYCSACATIDDDARRSWEEKGFAKFCSKCGAMLCADDSIMTGVCSACRIKKDK